MTSARVARAIPLGFLAMLTLLLPACSGSSVDSATCLKSLDDYHRELMANGDNADLDETDYHYSTYQHGIVAACDKATFKALLTGEGYDYTLTGGDPGGPTGVIAYDYPDRAFPYDDLGAAFRVFCAWNGAPKPNHC